MVVRGKYSQAVHAAAKLREEFPKDKQLAKLHKDVTVAMLLELGRRAIFDERNEEALAHFEKAGLLDPDNNVIADWFDKTLRELGSHWYLRARDLHLEERFEEALTSYKLALEYMPDHLDATEGMARALLQMNYRDGLSEGYYNDGVRALHDYMLQISRTRFGYSQKYRPGEVRSERRALQVEALLAQRRLSIARSLEADGKFAAANKEFQLALVLDSKLDEAMEGRDRTAIETEASKLSDKAAMMVLRHEWDRARLELEKGLAMTREQKGRFTDLITDIDDARAKAAYELALDKEHDYRYEDAIKRYRKLLDEREWYEDARARMSTLEEYVKLGKELYRDAAQAESEAHELLILQQIELFWPEYKDIQDRIVDLSARVGDEAEALRDAMFAAEVSEDERATEDADSGLEDAETESGTESEEEAAGPTEEGSGD